MNRIVDVYRKHDDAIAYRNCIYLEESRSNVFYVIDENRSIRHCTYQHYYCKNIGVYNGDPIEVEVWKEDIKKDGDKVSPKKVILLYDGPVHFAVQGDYLEKWFVDGYGFLNKEEGWKWRFPAPPEEEKKEKELTHNMKLLSQNINNLKGCLDALQTHAQDIFDDYLEKR